MQTPMLELVNVSKSFPGVRALDGVSFSCAEGEIRALVGENGAGKSTLLKIISGVLRADEGRVLLRGEEVSLKSPQDALRKGIGMVYQELSLLPEMSVAQNIFLNREPRRCGVLIDDDKRFRKTAELLERYGLDIDPDTPVKRLSAAQKQFVEIVKVLEHDPDILILDESTSSLAVSEVEKLFSIIHALRERGKIIIFITHRMEELFKIAGQVTILKDGQLVCNRAISEVTHDSLVELMVGRPLRDIFPPKSDQYDDEDIFEVRGLELKGFLSNIELTVRKGEILGIAGLQGHGQTELLSCLAGVLRRDAGEISLEGRKLNYRSPHDAIKLGIVLVPEDRKISGLCLGLPVRENIVLSSMDQRQKFGIIDRKSEKTLVEETIQKLMIKTSSVLQHVGNLSGGNQQKVVLGKCLAVKPKVLLFCEPTRGIDVGTKQEFYKMMRRLAEGGVAVIVYSSDLLETVGISDRVLVMYEGQISAELTGDDICEEAIMRSAMGLSSVEDTKVAIA